LERDGMRRGGEVVQTLVGVRKENDGKRFRYLL